jgi:hypothetical protein
MNWGDKVKCNAVLRRTRSRGGRRQWLGVPLTAPQTAVFLGYRTLSNGLVEFYVDHTVYRAGEYIRAALVSFGPHENPVYAPLDAISKEQP